MNPPEPLDLDAIEARLSSTTEPPWVLSATNYRERAHVIEPCGLRITDVFNDDSHTQAYANAEFVAHARKDVPALVAECRGLRAQLANAQSVIAIFDRYVRRSV